jgi:hypothetical protein
MASTRRLFTISPSHDNVVLNYHGNPVNQFALVASSYSEAAITLRKRFEGERHIDFDAYPIVFLYRHAIELYLKAVLLIGNSLAITQDDSDLHTEDVFKSHSLSLNLPSVKAIFKSVGWEDDFPYMGLATPEFEAVLKEFDELDRGSYTFRYTVNKDGTANIEEHFAFSIAEFAARIEPILKMLSGACYGLEEMKDLSAELYHEQMAELREYEEQELADYESDIGDYEGYDDPSEYY